jgi:hypothetical protein
MKKQILLLSVCLFACGIALAEQSLFDTANKSLQNSRSTEDGEINEQAILEEQVKDHAKQTPQMMAPVEANKSINSPRPLDGTVEMEPNGLGEAIKSVKPNSEDKGKVMLSK